MDMCADPRPPSAVSDGVGLVGLAGLSIWIAAGLRWGMDGPSAALVACLACAAPMIAWSLLVDRVHRRVSTGLDWARPPRPWRETIDVSLAKLVGLWATWGVIACVYGLGRWYWQGQWLFAMQIFALVLMVMRHDLTAKVALDFALSIPALLAGTGLGILAFRRVNEVVFRRVILTVLMLSGVLLLL